MQHSDAIALVSCWESCVKSCKCRGSCTSAHKVDCWCIMYISSVQWQSLGGAACTPLWSMTTTGNDTTLPGTGRCGTSRILHYPSNVVSIWSAASKSREGDDLLRSIAEPAGYHITRVMWCQSGVLRVSHEDGWWFTTHRKTVRIGTNRSIG